MSSAAEFMPAIQADPDDDVPRLIYADWLEDRGDPRGEFIRVQCELADRRTPYFRREELEQRERELLARHDAEWTAPLRGWVNHWKFRRGFVDEVLLTAEAFLAHADALYWTAPATTMRLQFAGPLLRRVLDCPSLRFVQRLDLSGDYLGAEGAKALAEALHLPALRELDLGATGMDAAATAILAQSPNLSRVRWLRLAEPAHSNDLADIVARLQLATPAHVSIAHSLAGSPCLAQLETLDLRNHLVTPSGFLALVDSRHLPSLHTLWMEGNRIDDEALLTAAQSPQLARLHTLGLGGNQLTDRGILALAESPYFSRLKYVNVTGNAISMTTMDSLQARFGGKIRW
jgi:uncharacterized protein (TIGR02996 family)